MLSITLVKDEPYYGTLRFHDIKKSVNYRVCKYFKKEDKKE